MEWDGVQFQILHPAPDFLTYLGRDNNYSCVLKMTPVRGSLLLTGDIQKEAENFLVKHSLKLLETAVLVIPHHGSNTSSSAHFITAVTPRLALASAGYLNIWKFPHADVLQRYRKYTTQILDTATAGAITLRFTAEGISPPVLAREQFRRYWHDQKVKKP